MQSHTHREPYEHHHDVQLTSFKDITPLEGGTRLLTDSILNTPSTTTLDLKKQQSVQPNSAQPCFHEYALKQNISIQSFSKWIQFPS